MNVMQKSYRLLREVKLLLPQDSWVIQAGDRHDGEFDDMPVLVHSGELRLDNLHLDELEPAAPPEGAASDELFLLLVDGNLVVDGLIYNDNTDGAVGLIVTGNVSARRMVVGGQEIYVGGDLEIAELFWGDYNHGELVVSGDASAPVWAETEGYRVRVRGRLDTAMRVTDWDEAVMGSEPLAGQSILSPECRSDPDDATPDRTHELLARAESLFIPEWQAYLRTHAAAGEQERVALPEVSYAALARLTQPAWIPAEPYDEESYGYEFWRDDMFFRVLITADRPGASPSYRSVYYERDEQCGILIETPPDGGEEVYIRVHLTQDDASGWYVYDESEPGPWIKLHADGWRALHEAMAVFELSATKLQAESIHELLAMPLIAPYDDYYDDDLNGFWMGDLYYAFRQADEEEGALLKVGREVEGPDEEMELACYYYEAQRQLDGSEIVFISYMEDEDNDEDIELSYVGGARLEEAIRLFHIARKRLLQANAELLSGQLPFDADRFATKYWRKQGYLTGRLP